eukprot:CAMPEP_0204136082 /NCGR_PEP_ID=MMETSP0361-20130328/16624_1 /ASSEMBLY_ACC=CAM_ASM_000343 /TAXON_ID=268821 /ORGANISM="Scrippsiella Hangoei, Strain SHTV-5" /LENGTH=380 /DNA_ID=CAMNT_0051089545 /DNA_START=39 /DNA_END=1178 /DNA_ORIENTATION=+
MSGAGAAADGVVAPDVCLPSELLQQVLWWFGLQELSRCSYASHRWRLMVDTAPAAIWSSSMCASWPHFPAEAVRAVGGPKASEAALWRRLGAELEGGVCSCCGTRTALHHLQPIAATGGEGSELVAARLAALLRLIVQHTWGVSAAWGSEFCREREHARSRTAQDAKRERSRRGAEGELYDEKLRLPATDGAGEATIKIEMKTLDANGIEELDGCPDIWRHRRALPVTHLTVVWHAQVPSDQDDDGSTPVWSVRLASMTCASDADELVLLRLDCPAEDLRVVLGSWCELRAQADEASLADCYPEGEGGRRRSGREELEAFVASPASFRSMAATRTAQLAAVPRARARRVFAGAGAVDVGAGIVAAVAAAAERQVALLDRD